MSGSLNTFSSDKTTEEQQQQQHHEQSDYQAAYQQDQRLNTVDPPDVGHTESHTMGNVQSQSRQKRRHLDVWNSKESPEEPQQAQGEHANSMYTGQSLMKYGGVKSSWPSGGQMGNENRPSKTVMKHGGVKSSCPSCEQKENEYRQRMSEMELCYKQQLSETSMAEMEKFYKDKLDKTRTLLKEKEEELNSFKDRMAEEVTLSIKTGKTESMNSPVSKTKLIELYEELRLHQWPKLKHHLKSNKEKPQFAKALIQNMFKDAADKMVIKKRQIDEVFGIVQHSSASTSQKVKEYKQSTIQNLQLVLYHSRKEDLVKTHFPEYEGEKHEDVMVNYRLLASQCCWLGGLMSLNNPPLQPDWKKHVPGQDVWDIFPPNIIDASVV